MKLFDTSLLPGKAEFFMDTEGQPVPYFCEELQLFYVLTGSAELHSLALDCTLRQNDFAVVNPYERYSLRCGEGYCTAHPSGQPGTGAVRFWRAFSGVLLLGRTAAKRKLQCHPAAAGTAFAVAGARHPAF